MTAKLYHPTDEQNAIIRHDGHAFVRACPGAGKTRTMVERARYLLSKKGDRRGVAFMSFTNAAVDELTARLAGFGVMPSPLFPSFIGTFDSFLWQFLIAPFGVVGCDRVPRLVPDKKDWVIKPPFANAQALTLDCFDRLTGTLIAKKAAEVAFAPKNGPAAWEAVARKIIAQSLTEGYLDFEDVRACVHRRLEDKGFAERVGAALSGRFREIVVDEAQDSNPADLAIVEWLRASGIVVKIICDPNQAIYGFRGGLTSELTTFADTFATKDRLPLSGNFRSSPAICAAINQLRPPASRSAEPDVPLGPHKAETEPVHLLAYGGTAVPAAIGAAFHALIRRLKIEPEKSRVLASTWASASKAVGQRVIDPGADKTLLLAEAVTGFHAAFEAGDRRDALRRLHRVVLLIRHHIANSSEYSTHLAKPEIADGSWRREVITIGRELRPRPGETDVQWLARARILLGQNLVGESTINQRMKANRNLGSILAPPNATSLPAQSIHAVKGLEFPAVCVVLIPRTTGDILDVLNGRQSESKLVEEARKIYVAASRAERLLAIATPKSRVAVLKALLDAGGAVVTVSTI